MASVIVAVPYRPAAAALTRGFRACGVEAYAVNDAVEALAVLRFTEPAALLTDLALRGMTGLQLLRALRNDPRHERLPVFVLTACRDRRAIGAAEALGATVLCRSAVTFAQIAERVAGEAGAHLPRR